VSVKININPFLTHITNNQSAVEVNGSTIGQCLQELVTRFPDLKKWLFKKDGKLSDLVDIYINGVSSFPRELATPIKDGDELHIIVIISGG
jgi:sulfur-carrier protein adenylyltransferase/sulfurtransferase